MPLFLYSARTEKGELVKGELEAAEEPLAVSILQGRGLFITRISEKGAVPAAAISASRKRRHRRIKSTDLLFFIQQLSILLESGIPLLRVLEILAEQTDSARFSQVIAGMRADIKSGATFHHTIAKRPGIFPVFWAPVVEAGEESGNLTRVLNQLGKSLEATIGFKRKIISAMFYPCVIVSVAVTAVLVFMLALIPIFSRVYATFNAKLPLFTRIVLGISAGLQRFFILWVVAAALCVYLFRALLKTPRGRAWFDQWILGIPVIGEMVRDVIHVRIALILSTLLEGGLNLLKTLDITARVSDNVVYGEALRKIIAEVQQGKSLGASFSKNPYFSHMLAEMIAIGEESGKLAAMLEKAGKHHETRVDTSVTRIGALIEPAIIIVVGVVIGSLVVSMFLPIFNLANIVQ